MDIKNIMEISIIVLVIVAVITSLMVLFRVRSGLGKQPQKYGDGSEECIIIPKEITGNQKNAQYHAKNIIDRLDWEHITSPRDLVDKLTYSLDFVIKSFKADEFLSDVKKSKSINVKKAVDTTHVTKY